MDSNTLAQIKELGVPAFSVIMLILTAVFLIRNAAAERKAAQAEIDESRERVDKVVDESNKRYDGLQRSFTQQLIDEKVESKRRETDLLRQLTETNKRVVDLQLEIGQVRSELNNSLKAVDVLTKERDTKAAEYEREVKARTELEQRVKSLESDLESSKNERRDLTGKYENLKKEHDLLVKESKAWQQTATNATQTMKKVK